MVPLNGVKPNDRINCCLFVVELASPKKRVGTWGETTPVCPLQVTAAHFITSSGLCCESLGDVGITKVDEVNNMYRLLGFMRLEPVVKGHFSQELYTFITGLQTISQP